MVQLTPTISLREPAFPEFCAITDAVQGLSASGGEARGEVFTRTEVVDFILDLAGYTSNRPLHELRLLEPSFGGGDFLFPAIERLLHAWRHAGKPNPGKTLCSSIRAVELHGATFRVTRERVIAALLEGGIPNRTAIRLTDQWLVFGDFLLANLPGQFDFVVGNPPYVRQELIPDVLMTEYRVRYKTIYDRADIYVPFIERALNYLSNNGTLGFICADRWMKNRYGGPLRAMVAKTFHLKIYVDMVDTPAFHSNVIAYPAITIIDRNKPGPTRIAKRPQIDAKNLSRIAKLLHAEELSPDESDVRELLGVASGSEPWILDGSAQLALVRRLEATFPALEDAQCKVGIGVATGDDKSFIGKFADLDVEADRKLPLVMTRDIDGGNVKWRGYGVINPFSETGGLVDLRKYPRLKKYLERRKESISKRHVAMKAPANWFRTIDRIYPEIANKPKLLIPDIKGAAHIVYENEGLYPHHNLYYITSNDWDLRALQAILLSGIAGLFVSTYSTKMRGGYLRFQAQYLRRIRVPHWRDVPTATRKKLIAAATRGDVGACNRAAFELYALSEHEQRVLGELGAYGT